MGWSDTFVQMLKNNDVWFVTCVHGGALEA